MEVFVSEVSPETYILMLALPPPPSLALGRVYATKSYCEDTTSLRPNLEEGGMGGRGCGVFGNKNIEIKIRINFEEGRRGVTLERATG